MRRGGTGISSRARSIDADVVVNVPKLKTHKKAGITGALKNLVGINGHKAFLPHHRKGGSLDGGDAYAGRSAWKSPRRGHARRRQPTRRRSREGAALPIGGGARARRRRRPRPRAASRARGTATTPCGGCRSISSGCSATAAPTARWPTRRVATILSVTDAVIAGQGEGPLAPISLPAGPGHARRPAPRPPNGSTPSSWASIRERVPIVAHAFDRFRFPLAPCMPDRVVACLGGTEDVACRRAAARWARASWRRRAGAARANAQSRCKWRCERAAARSIYWTRYRRQYDVDRVERQQADFAAATPTERRRAMARRLQARLRHFAARPDALPEWRDAAAIDDPDALWRAWPSLPILTKTDFQGRFSARALTALGVEGVAVRPAGPRASRRRSSTTARSTRTHERGDVPGAAVARLDAWAADRSACGAPSATSARDSPASGGCATT